MEIESRIGTKTILEWYRTGTSVDSIIKNVVSAGKRDGMTIKRARQIVYGAIYHYSFKQDGGSVDG